MFFFFPLKKDLIFPNFSKDLSIMDVIFLFISSLFGVSFSIKKSIINLEAVSQFLVLETNDKIFVSVNVWFL